MSQRVMHINLCAFLCIRLAELSIRRPEHRLSLSDSGQRGIIEEPDLRPYKETRFALFLHTTNLIFSSSFSVVTSF